MSTRKTVLITGASRGIGKHVAFEFAKRGYNVVLCARNMDLLEQNVAEITASGGTATAIKCDTTSEAEMRELIRITLETYGAIDIAILNAAIGNSLRFSDHSETLFREIIETNLMSVVNAIAILTEVMKKQGHGTIAGVSSLADKRSIPGSAPYMASKAALTLLLEAAEIELRPLGIKVITVRPGFVATDMTSKNVFPMPFLMSPEKAAKIIVRGIERGKRHIAFPFMSAVGSALMHLVPRWLWRIVFRVR
jgi:short-subunit dehydrogenase